MKFELEEDSQDLSDSAGGTLTTEDRTPELGPHWVQGPLRPQSH